LGKRRRRKEVVKDLRKEGHQIRRGEGKGEKLRERKERGWRGTGRKGRGRKERGERNGKGRKG
jgi:hypothetical protein